MLLRDTTAPVNLLLRGDLLVSMNIKKADRLTFDSIEDFPCKPVNVPFCHYYSVKSGLEMGLGRSECRGNHSFSSRREKWPLSREGGGSYKAEGL